MCSPITESYLVEVRTTNFICLCVCGKELDPFVSIFNHYSVTRNYNNSGIIRFQRCGPSIQSCPKFGPSLLRKLQNYLSKIYIFLNRSLLEYNCFTIPCYFLLHNKGNQPYADTCPHIPSLLSFPPILPMPPL